MGASIDLAASTEILFESPQLLGARDGLVHYRPIYVGGVHVCSPFFMPRGARFPLIKIAPNNVAANEGSARFSLARVHISVPQFEGGF